MIKKNFMAFLIITSIFSSVGCSSQMNSSQAEKTLNFDFHHWMQDAESKEKLQQGQTAYLAMHDAFRSIAARIYLIRHAEKSLDLQYYIWANDFIGNLMLSELLQAADRGVKVRLLIDDQNGRQLDPQFKALMQHPNIQIRVYNPYQFRTLRVFDYLFRAKQINRRMHNKLIIADGSIAVTGGRNIGGEYFDASQSFQFTDMDVLFTGKVLNTANQSFIDFWNHQLSVPIKQFLNQGQAQDLIDLRTDFKQYAQEHKHTGDRVEQEQQVLAQILQSSQLNWAPAYFLADSPEKTQGQAQGSALIYNQINEKLGDPHDELDLISAYFVPTTEGTKYLTDLAQKNIKVRVLTNAFTANDVALVHAFYQKYRVDLLKNGVKLYEFKPYIQRSDRTWYEVVTGNVIPSKIKSKSSLHAKLINVDDKVFIGSFNFDPRSANLNTEVGLVVQSDQLQHEISNTLDQSLAKIAYELRLDEQGKIVWRDHQQDGSIIEYDVDPNTTKFQRFMMHSVSYLPIEWMM